MFGSAALTLASPAMRRRVFAGIALAQIVVTTAQGSEITLNTTDTGWYTQVGQHTVGNMNTLTGILTGDEYRSYYVWNLPQLGGVVTAAHINIYLAFNLGAFNPWHDGPYVANMFDVSADHQPLLGTANGSGQGTEIFADLGSGTTYGQFTISETDTGSWVNYELNADALVAINAASGQSFVLGIDNTTTREGYFLFSTYPGGTQNLVMEIQPVPVPPTVWLLGTALAGLCGRRVMRRTVTEKRDV